MRSEHVLPRRRARSPGFSCPDSRDAYDSTRMSFMRPDAPLLIDTCVLRTPKCCAISATNSAFALPSIGGDLMRATQVPSSSCSRAEARAFGLTLTLSVCNAASVSRAFRTPDG